MNEDMLLGLSVDECQRNYMCGLITRKAALRCLVHGNKLLHKEAVRKLDKWDMFGEPTEKRKYDEP